MVHVITIHRNGRGLQGQFRRVTKPVKDQTSLRLRTPRTISRARCQSGLRLPRTRDLTIALVPTTSNTNAETMSTFYAPDVYAIFPLHNVGPARGHVTAAGFNLDILPVNILRVIGRHPEQPRDPNAMTFGALQVVTRCRNRHGRILTRTVTATMDQT